LERICVAEVEQAIGRGRGVSRTADNPLTVIVCNDIALPIAIDRTAEPWKVTNPDAMNLMFAEGGVAFANSSHSSRAYPELWPSPAAFKQSRHRGKTVTEPYVTSLIGKCYGKPRVATVRIRPHGHRERTALAFVDIAVGQDPRATVEALIGPLAVFEIMSAPLSLKSPEEQAEVRRALGIIQMVGEMFQEYGQDEPQYVAATVFMRHHLTDAVERGWDASAIRAALLISPLREDFILCRAMKVNS
jgi:hypothetical protein